MRGPGAGGEGACVAAQPFFDPSVLLRNDLDRHKNKDDGYNKDDDRDFHEVSSSLSKVLLVQCVRIAHHCTQLIGCND